LSINFDGKTFKAPKSLRIKSVIVISFVLLLKGFLNFFEENQEIEGGNFAFVQIISRFFLYFVGITTIFIKSVPYICTIILLNQQNKIAEIFTKFYELKQFCDDKKFEIDEKLVFKKVLKSFLVFLMVIILSFDYINLFFVKKHIGLLDVTLSIIDHILKTYNLLSLNFYNIILIHYEFLLENMNQVLENQFEIVHENCENLLKKLTIIKELFTSLNEIFGKIFTIEAFNELLNMISFVSKN